MERERYEAIIAGLQELLVNAETNAQSMKKIADAELENKQLEKKITENENEIKKLKAKIDELDFENRILKTKIAAEEAEKNHLQARVDNFDIVKAEQAGKNAPLNTLTDPQVQPEIVYLNNKITKQKNLKGWVSLGIVLLIAAAVLFLLNTAYKI